MLPIIQQQTHPLISGSELYYLNLVDHVIFAPVSPISQKTKKEIPYFAPILTVARQLHPKNEIKVTELIGAFDCVYIRYLNHIGRSQTGNISMTTQRLMPFSCTVPPLSIYLCLKLKFPIHFQASKPRNVDNAML